MLLLAVVLPPAIFIALVIYATLEWWDMWPPLWYNVLLLSVPPVTAGWHIAVAYRCANQANSPHPVGTAFIVGPMLFTGAIGIFFVAFVVAYRIVLGLLLSQP